MEVLKITGGRHLQGCIPISGAKNAALPLLISSLLTEECLTVHNVPSLLDVDYLLRILSALGVDYTLEGQKGGRSVCTRTFHLNAKNLTSHQPPYHLVSKMRASFWLIAPLLARLGVACVPLPGGCSIGARPLDFLFKGLEALGAEIEIAHGYATASVAQRLRGARYHFPKVTVGGTHVLLMAAALAEGETVLLNAAAEPEIANLADCINAMGGQISGAGTSEIHIQGVSSLKGAEVSVIPDRIELGTYLMAAILAGGDVLCLGGEEKLLPGVVELLRQTGAKITQLEEGLRVEKGSGPILPVDVVTGPYPGFPTDLQAQMMALLSCAQGQSRITEKVFENRFMHVAELRRLGAHIRVEGQEALIDGVPQLTGATVTSTDLRAAGALVIAGLAAQGQTIVKGLHHLDRGFEALEEKLTACGACIKRTTEGSGA